MVKNPLNLRSSFCPTWANRWFDVFKFLFFTSNSNFIALNPFDELFHLLIGRTGLRLICGLILKSRLLDLSDPDYSFTVSQPNSKSKISVAGTSFWFSNSYALSSRNEPSLLSSVFSWYARITGLVGRLVNLNVEMTNLANFRFEELSPCFIQLIANHKAEQIKRKINVSPYPTAIVNKTLAQTSKQQERDRCRQTERSQNWR